MDKTKLLLSYLQNICKVLRLSPQEKHPSLKVIVILKIAKNQLLNVAKRGKIFACDAHPLLRAPSYKFVLFCSGPLKKTITHVRGLQILSPSRILLYHRGASFNIKLSKLVNSPFKGTLCKISIIWVEINGTTRGRHYETGRRHCETRGRHNKRPVSILDVCTL